MRRLVVAVGIVAVLSAACSAGDADSVAESDGVAVEAPQAPAGVDAGGQAAADVEEGIVGLGAVPLPGLESAVIKDASLSVEVEQGGFKDGVQAITGVAARYGGYLVSSHLEGDDGRRGSFVLRIPSESFEAALADVRELGSVRGETVTGEDVGQEFVDLEARLRNLEAQEAVLLRLMGSASTISDTIRIQREVSTVQLEIERIRGRLRYLEDRTTYGTLSVELFEPGQAAVAAREQGIVGRAVEQAGEVLLNMAGGAIVTSAVVGPLAVVALLGWVVFRRLRPRSRPAG